MNIKKYAYVASSLMIISGFALAIPVLADNTVHNQPNQSFGRMGRPGGEMARPVIIGTVSSVSGNTVTISGHQGFSTTTPDTIFSVDTTNAKITKNNTAGTISSILSGDTVSVLGTINGTNITATMIRDGQMGARGPKENQGTFTRPTTPVITGDGQPVVGGTISAVNGSSITITNKNNTGYTIDVTNAKITQGQNTITLSDLKVGDTIIAQGTVNGTSVVATSVIDQTKPVSTSSASNAKHLGFFGGIGQFFAHLFGF